jgi:hypothetical protein
MHLFILSPHNLNPRKLCGLILVGLAAIISANGAWAGCNCDVPPAPMLVSGQGQWGASTPLPESTPLTEMSPHYQSMSPGGHSGSAFGVGNSHWAPGGYEARAGSPVYYHDPAGGQYQVTGNPYQDHFGPGFHRHSLYGHYRFPYYNYRAPWAFPGRAVYNRDTNLAW